jgi:hypothetical protein
MTRANAQVFATRQDLINARGLLEEQQAILKNLLTRTGNADPEVQAATIIPTDALNIPEKEEVRPIQDLFTEAMANRPDLGQASLQIENSQIGLKGARNATRPEVDLVGIVQNNGLAGPLNPAAPATNTPFTGGYGTVLDQLFTAKYPTYEIGVQVTVPIHNRIAEADLARDELQLKQSEVRLRQLQNQARLEVEDAVIAMRRARASYEAAVQASVPAGVAGGRADEVRSGRVHRLLRDPVREPAGAGEVHRSGREERLCEGPRRARARHRQHPGATPDFAGRGHQGAHVVPPRDLVKLLIPHFQAADAVEPEDAEVCARLAPRGYRPRHAPKI